MQRQRISFARSLVTSVADILAGLPPDEDDDERDLLAWMELWRGRLALASERHEEADAALRPLADPKGSDVKLALWAMGDLAEALAAQSRLTEAREVTEQAIELAEASGEDRWNWAFSHLTLGRLYAELREPRAACRSFNAALELAEGEQNERAIAIACIALASAQTDLGQAGGAYESALRALDLTRTSLRWQDIHADVLAGFVNLFQDGPPRLLDTVQEESRALSAGLTTTSSDLDSRVQHLTSLASSGQYTRSQALAEALEAEVKAHGGWLARANLSYALELLSEDTGQLRRAAEFGTGPRDVANREPMAILAAMHDRGRLLIDVGELEEGRGEVERAGTGWEELRCTVLAARAKVHLARVERRAGRLDEASRYLVDAWPGLAEASNADRAEFLIERGRVARDQGRWVDASTDFRTAMETERFPYVRETAVRPELIEVAVRQARWEEAAVHAASLRHACAKLEERDSYAPSPKVQAADLDNANGIRRFIGDADDPYESATRAKEHFESATDKVPENSWYQLNLAYAAAAADDWEDASRALQAALHRAEWLRVPVILGRLADWTVAQGRQLLTSGRSSEAAALLSDSMARLEQLLPPERLASLALTLGDALRADSQDPRAENAYRTALASGEPAEVGLAALNLAALLAARGATKEAEEAYRRVLQAGDRQNGPGAALQLADLLAERGEHDEVERVYSEVAGWDAASAATLGDLLSERDDQAGALLAYRHALTADPADPYRAATCVRLGDLLTSQGENDEAAAAFREAAGSPDPYWSALANFRLGELMAAAGDLAAAEQAFTEARAMHDESFMGWAALRQGEVLAAQGKTSAAEEALRDAMSSADSNVLARATVALSDVLASQGNADALAPLALEASSASSRTALALGNLLHERGDTAAAREALSRGAQRDGDLYQPDAALRLGEVLEEEGDLPGAEAAYRQAAESQDPLVAPAATVRLGDLLSARGDEEAARTAYEHAQRMGDAEVGGRAAERLAAMQPPDES